MTPRWIVWTTQHLFTSVMFFLTLVFVSILLRERKSPGAAIAWLITIVLAPYIGIPLYLFARILGGSKVIRKSKRKRELYSPVRYSSTPDSVPPVERSLLASGAPGKSHGNHIDLISDGTTAFQKLLEMIDGAESTIHISTFILGRDRVAETIVEHLNKKSRSGVKVRFLIDGFGALLTHSSRLSAIKEAGGRVASFMPFSNFRNHRKIVVVDEAQAMVGGMNLAHEYMGPDAATDRWYDLALFLKGPVITDISNVFKSDWKYTTGEDLHKPGKKTTHDHGPCVAQIVASGPDVKSDTLYDSLLAAIFGAKDRIWIATPYFIPDEALTRALELACRRGVDVQILVPRRSNHILPDIGRGSYIRQIEDEGANILLHPKMVHAKATLIDESYAIVGSANTDMRSFFLNYEVSVFLYSKSSIEAVATWFSSLAKESREGYPRAAFGMQTLEGAMRVISPLL